MTVTDIPVGAQNASKGSLSLAFQDFADALRMSWFWLALGWNDILQRYRGSLLGPFWLTLTTAAFIGGLGPLYSQLLGLNMKEYLPYLAIGFTTWSFISGSINESCSAFITSSDMMKQIKIPRLALLFRIIWRNIIVFAHNLPIYAVVLIFFQPKLSLIMLLSIPGFIIVSLNMMWIGLVFAILCARFRDIPPIINSILQIAFFLTPVMWDFRNLRVDPLYVAVNPFAAYVDLIRAPLLGEVPAELFIWSALGTLVGGTLLGILLFAKTRKQIIHWV